MKPSAWKASVLWQDASQRSKGKNRAAGTGLKPSPLAGLGELKPRRRNPPELIAAAHAGSFALTLASELAEAGYHPRQIETSSEVTMESVAARWTLTQIHLEVVAGVPNVPECDFVDAALRAKANCPVSRALNANISMRAKLNNPASSTRVKALRSHQTRPRRKSGTE